MFAFFASITSSTTLAASNSVEQPLRDRSIQKGESIRDIHNKALLKKLVNLNSDGSIEVIANAKALRINNEQYEEYIQSVHNINDIVRLGIASFDSNITLQVKPSDEITKIIFERDQKIMKNKLSSTNRFDANSTINLNALPTLYAFSIAVSNLNTIDEFFQAMIVYAPENVYQATVSFWISKVMPNGEWDYKVVPGYYPYSKEWSAVQRYTTSTKTSEWFGNYVYGFTGRYMFSLNQLLDASNLISYLLNGRADDPEDQTSVTQGYYESTAY